MRRFGTDRIKGMLESMGVGDQAIRSKALTRSIESAQKKLKEITMIFVKIYLIMITF